MLHFLPARSHSRPPPLRLSLPPLPSRNFPYVYAVLLHVQRLFGCLLDSEHFLRGFVNLLAGWLDGGLRSEVARGGTG